MTEGLQFSVLGPVGVRRDGVELDLGGRQQRLILALLLAKAGSLVTTSELIEIIWEGDPPASAANVVHRHIGQLRRLFEPDLAIRAVGSYLTRDAAGYRLRVCDQSLDLLRFRRLVAAARATDDAGHAVGDYLKAFSLGYGIPVQPPGPVSHAYSVFVALEVEYLQSVREAVDRALKAGLIQLLLPVLRHLTGRHPLDEALQARFVLALAADGRQAEAMTTFHQVRRRLDDELGIGPGPELKDAFDRMLHQRTGPDMPPAPPIRPAAQLPPRHPYFSGRAETLQQAAALLAQDRRQGRHHVALCLSGLPGVGKTTVAVELGHRLAGAYPDGQLYVDLRGFDPHEAAMSPAEALRGLLGSLGMHTDDLPGELHALAGLFRSHLASRRMLVVLDNCRDYQQVRHLLPGTLGSLAIVTSRIRLTELTAAGAHPLRLDLPSAQEARQLFADRLGNARVYAEPRAAATLVTQCGRVPLALAVVAGRAAASPHRSLDDLSDELLSSPSLWEAFSGLAAGFSLSVQSLTPAAAQLLALLPRADFDASLAAALGGTTEQTARNLLDELTTHLMVENHERHYRINELTRAYVRRRVEVIDRPYALAGV